MDAYSVLSGFVSTFQGGFTFVGVLLVIAGIAGVVLQWRSDGGGGGAQLAGAVTMIVAGIVITILANAFGSVDINWAKLPSNS